MTMAAATTAAILGPFSMECSLFTWPSITQFDDFSWAGLGDIDPLESLDRNFGNDSAASFPNLQETKPSLPGNTMLCSDASDQISYTQSGDLCRVGSCDSLAGARWESINAMDLESVLNSPFPSNDKPSMPSAEDAYDLYTDDILNDVDTFMSDSMSGVAEGNTTFLHNDNMLMNSTLPTPEPEEEGSGSRVNMFQPLPFSSIGLPACGDPCPSSQCASDLKASMSPQRHDLFQPNLTMQWPKAQSPYANPHVFDREKVVHHPAIIDQQMRLADVEIKHNRTQASKARRLAASQRRAKKYPLQKLIRMASSPTGTRDKLEQNMTGAGAIPHPPVHMVSQSRQEVLCQANPMQVGQYYCYQQTSATPVEDKRISSRSGVMQSLCTDQDVQSLSSTHNLTISHSANSTQFLDAALLDELQSILGKMNANVRLCIRDALYRLASSAKHRHSRTDTASDSSLSHSREAMETNTNSIDRWIVNLLFCKQPTSFESNFQPQPPTLTQTANHSMENVNIIGFSQQSTSCGSSVNLPPCGDQLVNMKKMLCLSGLCT